MRKGARTALDNWNADVAIVGSVKKPGETLSLWFVPRTADETVDHRNPTYHLNDVMIGDNFRDELRAQLTAEALTAVATFTDTEARGQVLESGLKNVANKVTAQV